MNLLLKYIIPIGVVAILSIGGAVGFYIYHLKTQIYYLNEKIKTVEYDLIKSRAEVLLQNQRLQEESIRITKYNEMNEMYKNIINNKYTNIKSSDKCEDNISTINRIFKKQGVAGVR